MKHLLLRLFSRKRNKTADQPITIVTRQELPQSRKQNATAGVDLSRDAYAGTQQPVSASISPSNNPDSILEGLLLGAICLAYLQKLQNSSCPQQTQHSKQRYKRKTPKNKNRTSYTAG